MKKIFCLIITIFMLVGCTKDIKVNTNYDSIELNVVGTMNAGCNSDDSTYLSHHYKDQHIYKLDFKNDIDYYANDIWVLYNDGDKQYLSYDYGKTFEQVDSSDFENNYRDLFDELLNYIAKSEKKVIEQSNEFTEYEIKVTGKEDYLFKLIKVFGITNDDQFINELKMTVLIDSNGNVMKISFNLKTTVSEEINIQSCYDIYWYLSDYNGVTVSLPNFSQ